MIRVGNRPIIGHSWLMKMREKNQKAAAASQNFEEEYNY
jgi:hypothetical protein